MYFYVFYDSDRNVTGWLQSNEKYYNPAASEVSKEKYIELGGILREMTIETPMESKLQAQQFRIDFLEECIVELAMKLYQ